MAFQSLTGQAINGECFILDPGGLNNSNVYEATKLGMVTIDFLSGY